MQIKKLRSILLLLFIVALTFNAYAEFVFGVERNEDGEIIVPSADPYINRDIFEYDEYGKFTNDRDFVIKIDVPPPSNPENWQSIRVHFWIDSNGGDTFHAMRVFDISETGERNIFGCQLPPSTESSENTAIKLLVTYDTGEVSTPYYEDDDYLYFDTSTPRYDDIVTEKSIANVQIYNDIELTFNEPIVTQTWDDDEGQVLSTEYSVYTDLDTSPFSEDLEYITRDESDELIMPSRDSNDEYTRLVFEHERHYLRSRSQYSIDLNNVWDRAGNALNEDDADYINQMLLISDSQKSSIEEQIPSPGASNVSITSTINVVFDEMMDPLSLMNAFSMTPEVQGSYTFKYDENNDLYLMIYKPTEDLLYGQEYQYTINSNARDIAGIPFEGASFKFTTEDDTFPPGIISKFPIEGQIGVPYNTDIYIQFDEKMLSSSINEDNVKLLNGSEYVPISLNYQEYNSKLYITPLDSLQPDHNYRVVIRGLMDSAGNMIDENSWDFFTKGNYENPKILSLDYIPGIEYDDPNDIFDNDYLLEYGTIEISFSKDMDTSEIVSENFVLFDGVLNPYVTITSDNRPGKDPKRDFTLTTKMDPRGDSRYPSAGVFYKNKKYDVFVLPNVKDVSGINLEKTYNGQISTTDDVSPYAVSTYPASNEIIPEANGLNYIRIYFNEDINLKDLNITGYNTVNDSDAPIDGADPILFLDDPGASDGDVYESIYVNERDENIDYNLDGDKTDYILEIFNDEFGNGQKEPFETGNYTFVLQNSLVGGKQVMDKANIISGNPLDDDIIFSFTIEDDNIAPNIISIGSTPTPIIGQDYTIDASIKIEFDEPLDALNLSDESVYVIYDDNGDFSDPDGVSSGEVEYVELDERNTKKYFVIFKPDNYLPQDSYCRLVVRSDNSLLQDLGGNAIASDYTKDFNTTSDPIVINHFPEDGQGYVPINSYIIIQFSETMDTTSINQQGIAINDGISNITGQIYYDETENIAYFYPVSNLKKGIKYTVSIGINDETTEYSPKDTDGNPLAYNKLFTFTTATSDDTVAPRVITTYPLNGTSDINIINSDGTSLEYTVNFSELMDDTTADGDAKTISGDSNSDSVFRVYYKDSSDNKIYLDDDNLQISYNQRDQKATFKYVMDLGNGKTYNIPLKYDTTYYAELNVKVEDMAGNDLSSIGTIFPDDTDSYVWSFKTKKDYNKPTAYIAETSMQVGTKFEIIFNEKITVAGAQNIKNLVSIVYNDGSGVMPEKYYDVKIENRTGDSNPFDGPTDNNLIPDEDYSVIVVTPTTLINNQFPNGDYTLWTYSERAGSQLTDLFGNVFDGDNSTADRDAGDGNYSRVISISDDIPPSILTKYPTGSAVSTNKNMISVWVEFSEDINHEDDPLVADYSRSILNSSNFYVESSGIPISVQSLEYYQSEDGNDYNNNGETDDKYIAVLKFQDDLSFNSDYKVVVKNIEDLDSDKDIITINPFSWTFTTKAPSPPFVKDVPEAFRNDITAPDEVTHFKITFTSDFDMDGDFFLNNIDNLITFRKYNSIESWPVTYSWENNNTVLVMNLDKELDHNSKYTLLISGNMRDKNGNTLDGDKDGTSEGSPVDDYLYEYVTGDEKQYLSVIQTNPYKNKTDVDINSKITVFFNDSLERISVIYGENNTVKLVKKDTGDIIEATLNYLNSNKTLVITPKSNLEYNTEYKLILSADLENENTKNLDGNGNNLFEYSPIDDYIVSFTTANDDLAPQFIASESIPLDDADDIGVSNDIQLVFSERLSDDILQNLSDYIKLYPGNTSVVPEFSLVEYTFSTNTQTINGKSRFVITISPTMPLANSSDYTINISSIIKDVSGNFIENPDIITFTTAEKDFDFVAFKNPAVKDEIFIIAKHSTALTGLTINLKQRNKTAVSVGYTATSGSNTYFASYKLDNDYLGMVTISAQTTNGLVSSIFMEYGYMKNAPLRLAGNFLKANIKDDSNYMVFYDTLEEKKSRKSVSSNNIEELIPISWKYTITASDDNIRLSSDKDSENPKDTGLYFDTDNGWKFIQKTSEDLSVNLKKGTSFAILRDRTAPRVQKLQKFYEMPVFNIEDASGFEVAKVIIDNEDNKDRISLQGNELRFDSKWFANIPAGNHNIDLRLVDGIGNTREYSSSFLAPGPLDISSISVYPNPATDFVNIRYSVQTALCKSVTLSIFDVSGRKIYRESISTTLGINDFYWDLRSLRGDLVSNGVYYYRLRAINTTGEEVEKTGKIAVLR